MTVHDSAAVTRMYEDDPRWLDPSQPHGLTRLQRDPDPADPGEVAGPDQLGGEFGGGEFGGEFGGEVWTVRRTGERWAGATVQRWCADCRAWTHVVDAGVPVDWDLDDRCGTCGRGFPLDPTA